ncbi:MAG: DUF2281 domain-containing protein [Chloroflexi bacterium]|nr:DUF2281 domain-containing protein [Chloroflexota bacterium]
MATHPAPPVLEKPAEAQTAALLPKIHLLLDQLPPERLSEVQTFVDFLLYQEERKGAVQKRIPGLHHGAVTYIADDFDDDLGDEFWFPEEDILTAAQG